MTTKPSADMSRQIGTSIQYHIAVILLGSGAWEGLRGKKARLSKKMQNILLLNSENSILVCTLAEF